MVIDRVMQERIAATPSTVPVVVSSALLSTDDSMAAAVGDAAELLDIDMDQLAGCDLLIANQTRPADREPCRLVEVLQQRHPIALEHPPDRRPGKHRGDSRSGADPTGA
ncbi:hypothetical protein GCM10009840_07210 [Pseudolysinimonas kribbensis]|uniref:Uncharacterized protein n=1 Tax=Pseudolysinimonas kribbensis TaxID=433641 RepID=A0ABQ6K553_9MICO|nr:hypothetical protein GCM10025881_19160 [Pseudolysinimonas kribbensis]